MNTYFSDVHYTKNSAGSLVRKNLNCVTMPDNFKRRYA